MLNLKLPQYLTPVNWILIDHFHSFHTGRPRPNVTWYLDNSVIDESFEQKPNGITVNHLLYPNIGRQHVNARFVCMASNTNLMPPNNKVLILDVNCKWYLLMPQNYWCMIYARVMDLLQWRLQLLCTLPTVKFIAGDNLWLFLTISNNWNMNLFSVKPTAVHILVKRPFVSAEKAYDVECKSSGSKPGALITWWRGSQQITRNLRHVSTI